MSYAINATNDGWRAVNSETDLLAGETYSDTQPVIVLQPQPNPSGFITACKTAVGGITAVASNPTLGMWSLTFNAAVQAGDWADVQTLVEHAQTSGAITAQQYADIKAAVIANNITGVTLP